MQDGFVYTLKREGKPDEHPSANAIDRVLVESKQLPERQSYWEVSKTIGGPLRPGLLRLRDLRNKVATTLGFDSFFALQVADYGLTVDKMLAMTDGFLAEIAPLYKQLHTWAKYTLADRYGVEPHAGMIPAHWLPNRWGQNWPGLVSGIDMDGPFKAKPKEYITEQAERFYVSLGLPKLPKTFYERSDLYPADPKSGRKKNSHASAWHIDLRDDVRSLMSIEPDSRWFTTAHHELGHIYYYLSYSTPEVPYLLRGGANRAFHEGHRRPDRPGGGAAALSRIGRPARPRGQGRRSGSMVAGYGAGRGLDRVPALLGRGDDPVRGRFLRGQGPRRWPECRLVVARRQVSGDQPARQPSRDALRPGDQDAYQRRSGRSIMIMRSGRS